MSTTNGFYMIINYLYNAQPWINGLQWVWYFICIGMFYLAWAELVRQCACIVFKYNFVNVKEICGAIYMLYFTHIWIVLGVMYSGYILTIMGMDIMGGTLKFMENMEVYLNTHVNVYGWDWDHRELNYVNGGMNVDKRDIYFNLNSKFDKEIKTNSVNIIKEKFSVSAPLLHKCHPLNPSLYNIPSCSKKLLPYVNLDQDSKIMEIEQVLHDKLVLHEFQKFDKTFTNKKLFHLDNPPFPGYKKILNIKNKDLSNIKWDGIPDALFYDNTDGTITTIQYKYSISNHFGKYQNKDFAFKYNSTTHLMKIMLAHGENFQHLCNIIKQHDRTFDTWIHVQPQYTNVQYNCNLQMIFREIHNDDKKFMIEQGDQIKHDFYHFFINQDRSKFNPDTQFIQALHQFEKTYFKQNSAFIPSATVKL